MLTFWIIAVGLTLLALAFAIPPLLQNSSSSTDVDRNQLNVAIYKEQLAELEAENLTPEQLTQAKQELQKTLAQDLDTDTTTTHQSRAWWVSIIVAITIPGLAIGGYWHLGGWHLLNPTVETEAHSEKTPDVLLKLAKRLEKQPNDLEGWQMLARSYQAMGDSNKTIQTYAKILAHFKEAEIQAHFKENPEALFFFGMAAMETTDYKAAIGYWQRLKTQIPSTDTKLKPILEKHIAQARQLAKDAESLNSGKIK